MTQPNDQPAGRRVNGTRLATSPGGMNAALFLYPDGHIEGTVTLTPLFQGPPQRTHGGALAALLDEVMGAAAWAAGYRVVAVNLNINYQQPVPLGVEVRLIGRVNRVEGRKVFTVGEIVLPDGTLAAQGTAVFVIAPQFFDGQGGFTYDAPIDKA